VAPSFSKRFKDLLQTALSTIGHSRQERETNLNKLRSFINDQSSLDAFIVMLDIYMQEYKALEVNNDKDAELISAYIFDMLFDKRIALASFFDDFVQRCIESLLYTQSNTTQKRIDLVNWRTISTVGEDISARFQTLNPIQKGNIIQYLRYKQKAKKNSLSLFEILVDIIWADTGTFVIDYPDLFQYRLNGNANWKRLHEIRYSLISAMEKQNEDGFKQPLQELEKLIIESDDMKTSFQYFLWVWNFVVDSERSPRLPDIIKYTINELYLVSSVSLIRSAINKGYGFVQSNLIDKDDLEILLAPLGNNKYYSTYHDRFFAETLVTSSSLGQNFIELTLVHLKLLLFAEQMHIQLASAEEQDRMLEELAKSENFDLQKRKVWVRGRITGNVWLNEVFEGIATIVYLPPEYVGTDVLSEALEIGISWKGIDHFIFLVSQSDLARIRQNRFYQKLHEDTKHLLPLFEQYFRLLTYVEALCVGGPPGLLTAIIIDVSVDKVSEMIENEKLEFVFQLAASLGLGKGKPTIAGVQAGKRITGAAIKTTIRGIRKIKTWAKPKSTIPRARVIKRKFSQKGTKASRAEAKRAETEAKRARDEAKKHARALKRAEDKARADAKKIAKPRKQAQVLEDKLRNVEIDLGHPKIKKKNPITGKDEIVELNGLDTIVLLFGGSIVKFSKLARHWPRKLEERYLKELSKLKAGGANKAEIDKFVEDRWGTLRETFWKNVWKDKELVAELKKIGIYVQKGGKAPKLKLPGIKEKVTLNLDHINRKIDHPREAFSIENIRLATPKENSGLKEALEKSTFWPSTPIGKDKRTMEKLSEKEFDEMIERIDNYPKKIDLPPKKPDPPPPYNPPYYSE
jgi:hypothetical protein